MNDKEMSVVKIQSEAARETAIEQILHSVGGYTQNVPKVFETPRFFLLMHFDLVVR